MWRAPADRQARLAREAPRGLSARNALPAQLRRLTSQRDRVEAELAFRGAPTDGATITVALTPLACAEMELVEGGELFAVFKASALRAVTESIAAIPRGDGLRPTDSGSP